MFFGLVLRFFEDPTTLFRWLIRQNSRPLFSIVDSFSNVKTKIKRKKHQLPTKIKNFRQKV